MGAEGVDSAKLFSTYQQTWQDEEQDRHHKWLEFFMDHLHLFAAENGKFDGLASLASQGLHILVQEQDPKLQQQLAKLVEGGLCMEMRSTAWKTCLDLSLRKGTGYYNQLVENALGQLADRAALSPEDIREHCEAASASAGVSQDAQQQASGPENKQADANAAPSAQQQQPQDLWATSCRTWLLQIEKE